jgi:glycosyltransferase involved in cell wall biosynthesis
MTICTYIVLIRNNINNIPSLVDSLRRINGNLRKEFIFIDDGSTDNSLNTLKLAVNDLPRTTIITQDTQGPTISINKGTSLATGNYIHFVDGDEILHPQSTSLLIEASLKLGTQVAIGKVATALKENILPASKLIESPIKEILINKIEEARKVGESGSLIHRALLEKTGKADSHIYTHNISLSLRCAKYSKFAYIEEVISSHPNSKTQHDDFSAHNTLKAIYNFAKDNPELFSNLKTELLTALSSTLNKTPSKLNYSLKSAISKYIKEPSLDKILQLYKQELDNLF